MTSQEHQGPELDAGSPEISPSDKALKAPTPPGRRARFRAFMARRGRFWLITLPLHALAFWVLYIAMVRLTEVEVVSLARQTAQERLNEAGRELNQIAVAHTRSGGLRHMFEAVLSEHRGMNLKLLFPDGRTIGAESGVSLPELEVVQEFIPSPRLQEVWLSEEGDRERVRGIIKVIASPEYGTAALPPQSRSPDPGLGCGAGRHQRPGPPIGAALYDPLRSGARRCGVGRGAGIRCPAASAGSQIS